MTAWLVAFVAVVLGLGVYTIFGYRRRLAAVYLAILYAVILIGGVQALGRPRPAWLGLPSAAAEVEVLAVSWDEGKVIWIWVREGGALEPRAYALPWNEKQAGELHDELERTGKDGVPVKMKLPVGWSPKVPYMPYPEPQQPLPPKGGASG